MKQCNEGAHKMERTEQMYMLHTQLDFGKVKVGTFANPSPPYSALLIIGVRGSWGGWVRDPMGELP